LIETEDILVAANCIYKGDVIAYPTESVFGLGCDIHNENAVRNLLAIKNRSIAKGFIVLASSFDQVQDLIQPITPLALSRVMASWPGAVTWVFPCCDNIPHYLRGDHNSLAIRVTAHPVARNLCKAFGGPIVSTSANFDGEMPATDAGMVKLLFADKIACLLNGALGGLAKPTPIYNAVTGDVIRQG
jgi:L-threonylcarbamoyladenylate synthase